MQSQVAPLQTAQVLHEVLLNLYANENKPEEVTPLDLALTSYLISRRAFDHEIYDSQHTLALRLSTDHKAVKRSLSRLDELGWITYRGQGIGRPKGISLNLDKLPAAQPIRDQISPDAARLVDFYIDLKQSLLGAKLPTVQNGKVSPARLKLPRDWRQRQLPSAQRLLTRYGSFDSASQRVQFLFHHEERGIQSKARKSLYNLLLTIPKARRLLNEQRERTALVGADRETQVAHGGQRNEEIAA